jgi:hypothetical protein
MAQEARAALAGLALGLAIACTPAVAQTVRGDPAWSQLPAEQQQILAPIRDEWESFDPVRKRKWIGIAQRYPKLSADEQTRLQRRMQDWAALSPDARRAARERYRDFEQLPADERQALIEMWEQYNQSREEAEAAAKEAASKEAAAPDAAAKDGATPAAGTLPATAESKP